MTRPVVRSQDPVVGDGRRRTDVRGVVVRGNQRGRVLGYPTANIDPGCDIELPADGVYGALACSDRAGLLRGGCRIAAVSVGSNSTFGEVTRTVEAYLLDFDGDLYGQVLTVHLIHGIRSMVTFSSVPDLVAQIADDVRATKGAVRLADHDALHAPRRRG